MKTSEQAEEVVKAFVSFQEDIKNPTKNKTVKVRTKKGSTYTYDYATLDSVIETIQKIATKHGLAFSQEVSNSDNFVEVSTYLFHTSGQWVGFGPIRLEITKGGRMNDQQATGSTITYARRYGLTSMAGIASEEDTDARDRGNYNRQKSTPKENQPQDEVTEVTKKTVASKVKEKVDQYGTENEMTDKQRKSLKGYFSEHDINAEIQHAFLEDVSDRKIEHITDLSKAEASGILDVMFDKGEELAGLLENYEISKQKLGEKLHEKCEEHETKLAKLLAFFFEQSDGKYGDIESTPRSWLERALTDEFWKEKGEDVARADVSKPDEDIPF